MHRLVRRAATAFAVAILAAAVVGGPVAAASARAALSGSIPAWANSANWKQASDPNGAVRFRVYLGWRDQAGAETLARAVSDPHSASYGKYVTPAQFRQRFAPAQASVGAIQAWIKSQGMAVGYTPTNNRYVEVKGTVARASAAFATSFADYQVAGKLVRSPSKALSIPSNLGITAVVGLDQSFDLVGPDGKPDAPPSPAFVNAPPCSTYYGEKIATTVCPNGVPRARRPVRTRRAATRPPQLQGAYGIDRRVAQRHRRPRRDGAIIDAFASPTIGQDANTYAASARPAAAAAGPVPQVVPPGNFDEPEQRRSCDAQGWYGEETLDVEAVHAMAPGANILYVGGRRLPTTSTRRR